MRTLTKELHQQKWLLLGGCLVGLIFPAAEFWLLHRPVEAYEGNSGAYVVYFAGAFFGILLALVAAYPDARKGARDFLLSKPFNCSRIFVTKVLVAAVTLPLTLIIITAPDLITTFGRSEHFAWAWAVLSVTCPLAVMLFSLMVLLVVITQDQGKSLVLAVWAAVLLYFLPPMLNGFEWLNILKHIDNPSQSLLLHLLGPRFEALVESTRGPHGLEVAPPFVWRQMLPYLAFVGAMAAGMVAFTWLAIAAMKKRWHWHPGHKTVIWAVGLASLFIVAQIVFHVGYNLRPVTEVSGRKIQNPFHFNIEKALKDPRQAQLDIRQLKPRHNFVPGWGDAVCCKDDLMFIVSIANEHITDPNTNVGAYLQHTVLYIYRFPYAETPDSFVSALDLSTSPRIVPGGVSIAIMGSWIKENWLYVCHRPLMQDPRKNGEATEGDIHIVAVDIANPVKPVLRGEAIISIGKHREFSSANVAVKGNYCYVTAGANLTIVSLETPGEPHLVKEVPFASLTPMADGIKAPIGAFIRRITVVDNMLMFSTDIHQGAFDISDPANPRTLFLEDVRKLGLPVEDWYLATWNGDYCYLASRDGLYVIKLLKNEGRYSLRYVGNRKTTPLEKLAYFEPRQFIVYNGYLVQAAGAFGLLVYDISDPAHPKRLYHADIPDGCERLLVLNGLLYARSWGNEMTFFSLPKAD